MFYVDGENHLGLIPHTPYALSERERERVIERERERERARETERERDRGKDDAKIPRLEGGPGILAF